jgi:hypothetical protein
VGRAIIWALSRNWFSEVMHKAPDTISLRLGDYERSPCFMTCIVSLPSEQFRGKRIQDRLKVIYTP